MDNLDNSNNLDNLDNLTNNPEQVVSSRLPSIKHIVLAGGGTSGLSTYGVLRQSQLDGFWNIENIESIYGTSIGSIIGVFTCLKYSWEDLDDYIIKRPWQNVFKFTIESFMFSYKNRGMFDKRVIDEMLYPLLKGKDMNIDITMEEFYEKTQIDFHAITTELNNFEIVDISHKTHPQWKVTEAVYCSACLPLLFSPWMVENKCYVDGGAMINYPLNICLKRVVDPDSVFGITLGDADKSNNSVTKESTLFDTITILLGKLYEHIYAMQHVSIKNEVLLERKIISIYDILDVAASADKRGELIQNGVEIWKKYVDDKNK